ncbi:hypothetical protein CC80DRAFT_480165 [Byssothecium circinans]|uniref:Uncharacterized protein n=1 Tax=Byssothecium circinans TaxID=147558 RepID=A0A6A5TLX8_9PLEO|nr:hypothetical protein CC80DRAFT_480165 [Byssothecium circinans]
MVYITSELFDSGNTHGRSHSPCTHTQGSDNMAETHSTQAKRKRRVEDDDGTSPSKIAHRTSPAGRGSLRLLGHNAALDSNSHRMYPVSATAAPHATSERRPIKQMRRSNLKLEKQPSRLMDIEPDPAHSSSDKAHRSNTSSDLRPCHVCNAAPKWKRELEEYMDCRRCEGRTCYICARQCFRCGQALCRKCTAEDKNNGDTWCLECYSHLDPDPQRPES